MWGAICVIVTLVGAVWKPPAWLGLGEGSAVAGVWAQDLQLSFACVQSREFSISKQLKFLHSDLCPHSDSELTAADKCQYGALLPLELWAPRGLLSAPTAWLCQLSAKQAELPRSPPGRAGTPRPQPPLGISGASALQSPLPTLLPAPGAVPAAQEGLSCVTDSVESDGR